MTAKSKTSTQGSSLIRLGLAAMVVAILWIGASALWHVVERDFEKPHLIALSPHPRSTELRKGNINGVPVAVPVRYLYFPFEYKDKSIWEPRKPGARSDDERTFDDALSAFTVYVSWPDMLARDNGTDAGTRSGPEPDAWLLIAVGAYPADAKGRDLGWAPVLMGQLERLSRERLAQRPVKIIDPTDPERKRRIPTGEPRYELRGIDPLSGLKWAEPVGPGTERFYTWNLALYWHGDMNGFVSDYIRCYNGTMPNPNSVQKCRHKFKLPEFGASITIEYPRRLLAQWRELKINTTELILGFQSTSEAVYVPDQEITDK